MVSPSIIGIGQTIVRPARFGTVTKASSGTSIHSPKSRKCRVSKIRAKASRSSTSAGNALSEYVGRPLNESAQVEAVPHVPKCEAHQRLLENWSRCQSGLFQHNLPLPDSRENSFTDGGNVDNVHVTAVLGIGGSAPAPPTSATTAMESVPESSEDSPGGSGISSARSTT